MANTSAVYARIDTNLKVNAIRKAIRALDIVPERFPKDKSSI